MVLWDQRKHSAAFYVEGAIAYWWTEWRNEVVTVSAAVWVCETCGLSCHCSSVPAARAGAALPQTHCPAVTSRKKSKFIFHQQFPQCKGKFLSSTLLCQLKVSSAGPVSVLLHLMLSSRTEKGQDQAARCISSLSTVSRLPAKISVISWLACICVWHYIPQNNKLHLR